MIRQILNNHKTFPQGGVHPFDFKLSAVKVIQDLALPDLVTIPLSQHLGAPAAPDVNVGDKVKTGQLIAKSTGFISASIHASVSGMVQKIEPVLDISGYKKMAIVIQREGDDWEPDVIKSDALITDLSSLNPEAIIAKIKDKGIVGLGGATFPAHVKLSIPSGKKVEYLLINGVECEPFLTSDHRIMLEKGPEIIVGVQILLKALKINRALIGIEENKPDAIQCLQECAKDFPGIEVHGLKVLYPQGGERQLIKALVNREVPPPPKGLPIDVGCVVFNVATVFAVYEAVMKNKPLVERVVTVTGPRVKNPCNLRVRIGTMLTSLLEAAGGLPDDSGKILMGGPMMGKALSNPEVPVTKGVGGIVILPDRESSRKETLDCIRCAKCVTVCPLGMEPYLLMALAQRSLFERAEKERILNCCECGCCSFICPSNRPLLDHIRVGKTTVLNLIKAREKK